jgi:phosphomannomutase
MSLKDGWWLLRASNTQAAIVLRCESNTAHGLKKMIDSVKYELGLINSKLAEQIIT